MREGPVELENCNLALLFVWVILGVIEMELGLGLSQGSSSLNICENTIVS
jgi:hypothetical protein